MTQINILPTAPPSQTLTFEQYRFYQDETDTRYELHRGKLIPMPTATGLHGKIIQLLIYLLQHYIAEASLNLVVVSDVGVRTGIDSSRIPDVVVCTPELWQKVCDRSGAGILELEEIPNLVIEVTSENWRTDYILKRAEYALIDIPEYWIIDPNKDRIRILNHPEQEDGYEHHDFLPGQAINFGQFPDFQILVDEILSPPTVEELMRIEQIRLQQLQQQRDEAEQQQHEAEQQRDQAQQRAEKLANLLRQQGIDPDNI